MTTVADPIPILARRGVGWYALHVAHRHGLDAGVSALGEASGGTVDLPDGTRGWYDYRSRRFTLRIGEDRQGVTVPAKQVLAWALARFDPAALAELDVLVAARTTAVHQRCAEPLFFKSTYQPSTLTDDERALIRDCWDRQIAAEMAAHRLVDKQFDGPAQPIDGEQLDLFDLAAP